ncbi:MAG: carboxypeptidase regulatory-like domain-containing protein [Blastocatellia bacterium]|nr:carboxypeptidase regulatory-like domain-containing protein [Blastocatellia bacterium]
MDQTESRRRQHSNSFAPFSACGSFSRETRQQIIDSFEHGDSRHTCVGQASGSGIVGVVRDQAGGAVMNVAVEAASPALIEGKRTAVTDSSGQYRIIDLRPGGCGSDQLADLYVAVQVYINAFEPADR